jgi:hypothetical protein
VPSFDVGANYLPGDMLAKVHAGERIVPAADNRALMARLASPMTANDLLLEEVRRLNETVSRQEAQIQRLNQTTQSHLYAIAKYSQQTADHLDAAINGGAPLSVKASMG